MKTILRAAVLGATTVAALPGAMADSHGKAIYNQTCVACHGVNGKGAIPGTPDFTRPGGRLSKPDEVLVRHVTDGFQSPGSPMAMPPKGGNASLTEADIRAVIAYLRSAFGGQ